MKLRSLCELYHTDVIEEPKDGEFDDATDIVNRKKATKRDERGEVRRAGAFAAVTGKSDFTINKTSHVSTKAVDPFHEYVKAINSTSDMKTNPFLPRVYSIKNTKDSRGDSKQEYEIERLVDAHDVITPELVNALGDQLLYRPDTISPDSTERKTWSVYEDIIAVVRDAIRSGESFEIKDEQLAAAATFVNSLYKQMKAQRTDVRWDLHSGNFMFRRTPHGLQLVINDPFMSTHGYEQMMHKSRAHNAGQLKGGSDEAE